MNMGEWRRGSLLGIDVHVHRSKLAMALISAFAAHGA
jgi:hypothetical protein